MYECMHACIIYVCVLMYIYRCVYVSIYVYIYLYASFQYTSESAAHAVHLSKPLMSRYINRERSVAASGLVQKTGAKAVKE